MTSFDPTIRVAVDPTNLLGTDKAAETLALAKIVDCSADFRLRDPEAYTRWVIGMASTLGKIGCRFA